jgi:hypothetical protein
MTALNNIVHNMARALNTVGKPVWAQWPMLLMLWYALTPGTIDFSADMASWANDNPQLYTYWQEKTHMFMGIAWVVSYTIVALYHYLKGGRRGKCIIYGIAMCNLLIYRFIFYNFGTRISPELAIIMAETTPSESQEFFSTFLFSTKSWLVYGIMIRDLSIILLLENLCNYLKCKVSPAMWLKATGSLLVAGGVTYGACQLPLLARIVQCKTLWQLETLSDLMSNTATDELTNYVYTAKTLSLTVGEIAELVDCTTQAAQGHEAQLANPHDSLNVVVVIGESYNKHHAGIYGYNLATTPHLNREQQQGNLVVFNDVISPYNTTSITLKNVLSCNTMSQDEPWWQHPMFPALFKTAGYEVLLWDNQTSFKRNATFSFSLNSVMYNSKIMKASYDALNKRTFRYDHQLVDDFFKAWDSKPHKSHRLGILHLMGQHIAYDSRYPHGSTFNRFNASHIKRNEPYLNESRKHTIAQYDNATRYNDAVMSKIFDHYRGSNTVVLYFSDHGEEVYDYRAYMGRDHNPKKTAQLLHYQNEIPFMLWFSPQYQKLHPQAVQQARRATSRPFCNDVVSNILFNIGEINTPHYAPQHDPLNPHFKPSKRPVYGNHDYNLIIKTLPQNH